MRETKGHGTCPICKGSAEIRENVKQKLYAYCAGSCGLIQATGPGAQAHFAAMLAAGQVAAPEKTPAPPADDIEGLDNPAGQPVAVKKPGLLASILNAQVI